eukprot:320072-Pelagomonas_calceolata.AAC.1
MGTFVGRGVKVMLEPWLRDVASQAYNVEKFVRALGLEHLNDAIYEEQQEVYRPRVVYRAAWGCHCGNAAKRDLPSVWSWRVRCAVGSLGSVLTSSTAETAGRA